MSALIDTIKFSIASMETSVFLMKEALSVVTSATSDSTLVASEVKQSQHDDDDEAGAVEAIVLKTTDDLEVISPRKNSYYDKNKAKILAKRKEEYHKDPTKFKKRALDNYHKNTNKNKQPAPEEPQSKTE